MDRSRASTLPRRKSSAESSVGLFVKAHDQKKLIQANQSYSMTHVQQVKSINFVDNFFKERIKKVKMIM